MRVAQSSAISPTHLHAQVTCDLRHCLYAGHVGREHRYGNFSGGWQRLQNRSQPLLDVSLRPGVPLVGRSNHAGARKRCASKSIRRGSATLHALQEKAQPTDDSHIVPYLLQGICRVAHNRKNALLSKPEMRAGVSLVLVEACHVRQRQCAALRLPGTARPHRHSGDS